jgi:leucyl aminopeptidase
MDVDGEDWELTRMFIEAGQETDEPHWPLPLYEPYFKQMESNIANINNISSEKWGGAITAALFLKQFVGDTPWKHIDIAGPDIFAKAKRFWPEGASGFGVRSGVRFLERYLESKIEADSRG